MKIALWIVQVLLAMVFLHGAQMQTFGFTALAAREPGIGHLRPLFLFIAGCETLGAVGLILPMATRVLPFLTPWAAAGLAVIAGTAGGFHVARGESYGAVAGAVLAAFALLVVWGRGIKRIGMPPASAAA
jgi:putative oxidoreductase